MIGRFALWFIVHVVSLGTLLAVLIVLVLIVAGLLPGKL